MIVKENELTIDRDVFENELFQYTKKLKEFEPKQKAIINISECRYHTPAAIFLLFRKCQKLIEIDVALDIVPTNNDFYQYLQRMNFFKLLNIDNEESFKRHNPAERFMPIVEFGQNSRMDQNIDKDPDELSKLLSNIAINECVADKDEHVKQIKRGIIYSSGELIMNVIQHSRGTGYAFAQYNSYKDYVRLAILDNGIGIKGSFEAQQSKHYNPNMNDLEAIKTALDYEVSSKPIGSKYENAGVGLTYLSEIVKIAGVDITIVSNNAFYNEKKEYEHETPLCYGTLCSITLRKSDLINFNEVFIKAQSRNLL